jgi:hypothetical protein
MNTKELNERYLLKNTYFLNIGKSLNIEIELKLKSILGK